MCIYIYIYIYHRERYMSTRNSRDAPCGPENSSPETSVVYLSQALGNPE